LAGVGFFGFNKQSKIILYLAVRDTVFIKIFTEEIGKILLEDHTLKLIVFDSQEEVITKWIN
jgi:hypothetical protein